MGIFTERKWMQQIYVRPKILIVLVMFTLICFLPKELNNGINKNFVEMKINNDQKEYHVMPNKIIPFFVVMCKGSNKGMTSHQLIQAQVLIKSAAALTRVNLKFTIFSDSESLYQDLVSPMKLWPEEYQLRIQLEFYPIRYPPGNEDFRRLFRPCASFRLLMPQLLQHIDAAVYIDTDVIFLLPPEEIWKEFTKFNDEQLIASAKAGVGGIEMFQKRFELNGSSAVNSGIILMNFTRLRSAPGGGFTNITRNLFFQYKGKLPTGDQDIINIYFAKRPKLLCKLGCEWNYSLSWCRRGDKCPEAEMNGASIVHGASGAFFKNDCFKFFFAAWEEYELGTSMHGLMRKIVDNQMEFKSRSPKLVCSQTNISSTFTKKLMLSTI